MDPKFPSYEVPKEMREIAEKSVEQAKRAFDGFIGAAQKASDQAKDQATLAQGAMDDLAKQALEAAERNVNAAFDLATKIVRSTNPQEMLKHQAEFLQSQMQSLQAQMQNMAGDAVAKATEMAKGAGAAKPSKT